MFAKDVKKKLYDEKNNFLEMIVDTKQAIKEIIKGDKGDEI